MYATLGKQQDGERRYWFMAQNVFLLTMLGLALLCSIWLIALPLKSNYSLVVVEPLIYIIGLFLLMLLGEIRGVGSIILVVAFFLKLCVLPIVNHYGDYYSVIGAIYYLRNWDLGCIGIAAEWVVCSVCIIAYNRFVRNHDRSSKPEPSGHAHWLFFLITAILTVFVLACLAVFPNFRLELFWIWDDDTTSLVNGSGAVFYLFKRAFEIGRIMLCFYLVVRLSESDLRHKRLWIGLVAVISVFVQSEYRIIGFLVAIVIVAKYLIMGQNGKPRWGITIALVLCFSVAVIAVTTDFGRSVNLRNVSRLLDIYCGGYMQAAASFGVDVPNGFMALVNAVWNQTLFLKNIFGEWLPSTQSLKIEAFSSMGRFGERIFFETAPLCWKTYGIFAPLGMAIPIVCSLDAERRQKEEPDALYSLVFLFVCVSLALFVLMYSHDMVLSWIVDYILPLLIITYLDRRFGGKGRLEK